MVSYNLSKIDKSVEEQRKALKEAEKKRDKQLSAIYSIIGEKIVNDLNIDCMQFTSKEDILNTAETIAGSVDKELLSIGSSENSKEIKQEENPQKSVQ